MSAVYQGKIAGEILLRKEDAVSLVLFGPIGLVIPGVQNLAEMVLKVDKDNVNMD